MGRLRSLQGVGFAAAAAIALLAGCHSIHLPFGLIVNFSGSTGDALPEIELQQRIRLPNGFYITTYAAGISGARMLRFTQNGDLLVSAPRQGKVVLVERGSTPAYSAGQRTVLDDLTNPHGLALHEDWLYVAEETAIFRIRFDAASGKVNGSREYIARLPPDGRHWTRTIGIGPDDRLYVSVGSSCNVCIEEDLQRAAMTRYRLDGSDEQLYATGLRNTVGFAWHSASGELYATDNGRDLLGDDFPPCELNRIVEGGFYGWPYANGNRVPDPDYGAGNEAQIAASLPPVHGFGAHTAPLGITFYAANSFPERYRGAAFVAQHGSWNRSQKSGYKVVALFFDANDTVREEEFAGGFEVDDKVSVRPVDVAVGPDGALYVSDDYTGSIYRIGYGSAPSPLAKRQEDAPTAPPVDPLAALSIQEREAAVARGKLLWERNSCASCHVAAADSATQTIVRPLKQLAGRYDVDSLARFLKTPQPPMPALPFSDDQRRDLAIYLLSAHQ